MSPGNWDVGKIPREGDDVVIAVADGASSSSNVISLQGRVATRSLSIAGACMVNVEGALSASQSVTVSKSSTLRILGGQLSTTTLTVHGGLIMEQSSLSSTSTQGLDATLAPHATLTLAGNGGSNRIANATLNSHGIVYW